MATFTNTSKDTREVPQFNLVILPGGEFEIPDGEADGLRSQPWCVEKVIAKKSDTVTAPVDAEQGTI